MRMVLKGGPPIIDRLIVVQRARPVQNSTARRLRPSSFASAILRTAAVVAPGASLAGKSGASSFSEKDPPATNVTVR